MEHKEKSCERLKSSGLVFRRSFMGKEHHKTRIEDRVPVRQKIGFGFGAMWTIGASMIDLDIGDFTFDSLSIK